MALTDDIRYNRKTIKEESALSEYRKAGQNRLKTKLDQKFPTAIIKDNFFSGPSCMYMYNISQPIGILIKFPNQYGASIIRHDGSYGGRDGLLEMGVAIFSGDLWGLCYDTHITSDVLGYLTEDELIEHLKSVRDLDDHTKGES